MQYDHSFAYVTRSKIDKSVTCDDVIIAYVVGELDHKIKLFCLTPTDIQTHYYIYHNN